MGLSGDYGHRCSLSNMYSPKPTHKFAVGDKFRKEDKVFEITTADNYTYSGSPEYNMRDLVTQQMYYEVREVYFENCERIF